MPYYGKKNPQTNAQFMSEGNQYIIVRRFL